MLDRQRVKVEKEVRKALRSLGKTKGGAFGQISRRYFNTYNQHKRKGHPDPHRSEELLYLARMEATRALVYELTQGAKP